MIYSTYRKDTGLFLGRGSYMNPADEPAETASTGVLLGIWGDPLTQKVENGEVVPYTPPPPAPAVPTSVSPWQMRRALNQLGLRSTVEAAVAAADQDTKDGWEFATEFRRDNALLLGMAASLNMADQDLDDLFTLAASFQ